MQENTYSVYAGLDQKGEAEFLRIDEVSDDWNRCCCKPYHPLRLEVRPYIPVPGDNSSSDYSHIGAELLADWSRLTGSALQTKMRNMYMQQPPLFSMVRNNGQRCCCKCPCKWLSTFVCCSCCQDGMHIYAGGVQDDKEKGLPRNLPSNQLLGSVTQPIFAGCCTPTLHLRGELAEDDAEPFGKIEGPCCFGGWSEMCCDFKFFTSYFKSGSKAGDIGVITKKKPQSIAGGLRQLLTDADVYTIQFQPGSNLSASQKLTVLTGQVLADYMYFDGNTEKCSSDENAIYCYCFYCSVVGYICPCYIAIPTKYN